MSSGRSVAITGVGLLSSIGNDYETVSRRLKGGESGVRAMTEWSEYGLKSLIGGAIVDVESKTLRANLAARLKPALSNASLFCVLAAVDAVADASLGPEELGSARTGCVVGCGVAGNDSVHKAATSLYAKKPQLISPYTILRSMCSTPSMGVAYALGIRGRTYSLSSACATAAHAIGHAFELIRSGKLDRVVAGGSEDFGELNQSALEALRIGLSSKYNDRPQSASRPYDRGRDGFVASGGAGIVVLEARELAVARQARIRGEILGFGANCDAFDLVAPDPTGKQAALCMYEAMSDAGVAARNIDYINTHGTSTPLGDAAEAAAIRAVFQDRVPRLSSTKSMTGHGLGAAGAQELIYCLAMMEGAFIAPSINIDELDPAFADLPIIRQPEARELQTVMTNSFGFGGANATLVVRH